LVAFGRDVEVQHLVGEGAGDRLDRTRGTGGQAGAGLGTQPGSNRWPKAASRAAAGPVRTARAALASSTLPPNRSSAAITAEPNGAPAAMARLSAAFETGAGALLLTTGRAAS